MTAPAPDSMPDFKPSWVLPILAGAGGTILWQLIFSTVPDTYLAPNIAELVSCCGSCGFPIVLGFLPALIASSRDPGLRPGEGFTVSFIAVGAGVLVMLVVLYMQTSIPEMRQRAADGLRQSLDLWMQEQPDLDLDEKAKEDAIALVGSVAPYMPLGIGLVAALLSGVCGMISVIVMRGRRRSSHSTTSL